MLSISPGLGRGGFGWSLVLIIGRTLLIAGFLYITLSLWGCFFLLSGTVNGHLDSDLATLDLSSIHLTDSLLAELRGGNSNKAEPTTLAALVACLQLFDQEPRDRTESNLGRNWLVGGKKFLELYMHQSQNGEPHKIELFVMKLALSLFIS